MRARARVVLAAVGAAAVVGLVAWLVRTSGSPGPALPPPRESSGEGVPRADFVGANQCASCHRAEFAAWQASTHGRAGGVPTPDRVIGRFDGTPIRFANATVIPRVRRGGYEFEVRPRGDSVQLLRVDGVIGAGRIHGGGTQGYVTDRGDGSWRFLPFEWSRQSGAWFCNTSSRSGRGWAVITPAMRLEECGDWPPVRVLGDHPRFANCQSCHASQAVVALDTMVQGYVTRFTSLAINCESCHGPGERHVRLARSGLLGAGTDIGFDALATLDTDASVGVCLQCHAVKDRLRPGFVSGERLARYYSVLLPMLGDRPLHPDGRTRTFAYQEGHLYSDCYVSGGMTCTSCHDPHGQGYRSVTGAPLRDRFDERQCTSCHLSKQANPASHTKHPEGTVTCVSCHMPARQQPETMPRAAGSAPRIVPYARFDHTIGVPRPEVDASLGMASACATCHRDLSVAEQAASMRRWWGVPKPPVTRDFAAGQFADAAQALEARALAGADRSDADEARLREMARSRDVDVRAIALATLHLERGDAPAVRRMLSDALRAEGERDAALRDRWATILGYVGDRRAAAGATAGAVFAYQLALEVQPANARIRLRLADAQRASGDLPAAVQSYRASLDADPLAPLAWVNFGIALADAGDTTGAMTSLARAAMLDAAEPLAWYNLGNLVLLRGDLRRAREYYGRAASADPGIATVHFQLARVSLLAADSAGALRHLRRGLALDSSDALARAEAQRLDARIGARR